MAAAAADTLLQAMKQSAEKRHELLGLVSQALDQSHDLVHRKLLQRAKKHLDKGRVPEKLDAIPEAGRTAALAAAAREEQARLEFEKVFHSERAGISIRIMEIARDDRFRQAVLLQNREALRCVVQSLSAPAAGQRKHNSKDRQHEELIASYLQRYCVKNDSIGFFGPIGWIKFVPEREDTVVRPGAGLVARSGVYFEHWGIEALAQKIAEEKSIKPWIAPRLSPAFRVEGTTLHIPGKTSAPLPPFVSAILGRCNGERTARQIALEYGRILGLKEEDVYSILADLAHREIIEWKFDLPFELHPERRLQSLLARIEKPELRGPAVAMLDALEAERNGVSNAIGSAEQLDQALGRLDEAFVRLTGTSTNRSSGQMYAARTLVYQDCLRDIDIEIGSPVISALGRPLSLLMTSARWLTHEAALLYQEAFQKIYAELSHNTGKNSVDYLQFRIAAEPVIDSEQRLINRVVPRLQALWNEILQVPDGVRVAHYKSADLRERVEAAFAAPRAGWQMARHHSPDVMICAESVESLQRGDYFFVLGELHVATNTLRGSFAMVHHPFPDEMREIITADMPSPQVWPLLPRNWPGITTRTSFALLSPQDYYLRLATDSPSHAPRLKTLPVSDLVIENTSAGLIVRSRQGLLEWNLMEFLGVLLSARATDCMRIFSTRRHVPRIMIDQLVICRESWSFSATEFDFIQLDQEKDRFLGARQWMSRHDLPRFAFVRASVERKPFFVDFESPVYVEILSRIIRRVLASERPHEAVVISEMLPTPDQVWLPDAAGEKYTGELRIVMLDMQS